MKYSTAWHGKPAAIQGKMKQFKALIRKEFFHIFRDRWTMIILLLLPIVMLVLFGYAITTEVKNTRVAVYDPSKDQATKGIIEKLQVNEYFILDRFLTSPAEIENVFREGSVGLVIVFSEDFYENLLHTGDAKIQLIADGSDPNSANTLTNYAENIIGSYQQQLLDLKQVPYQIKPEVKLLYNPEMKGAYNFVPGVMGMILMLICAMMTSISITREKEQGTMEVLLVSPMKPLLVILSKAVPYFFLSIVNLVTILAIAVFVMDVPIAGSLFWLIIISLLFIFVGLSLGLLISSAVDKQLIAMLISGVGLMLPVILLSGMMFPIENMPWFLRILSNIIPAKYYIIAVKNLMIKGLGFSSIIREMIILGGMALFLVLVSLRNFKTRLE